MFLEVSFKLSPRIRPATRRKLLWCLLVALVFIFRNGYEFNSSGREGYPAYDHFVQRASLQVTERSAYVKTVAFFSRVCGAETACFLLFIVCVTLAAFFMLRIAERWYGDGWGSRLAPVFVLLFYNDWTVGGYPVMNLQLSGATFAIVFCLAAIWRFTDGHYRTTGLLLGISAIYQLQMGLQLAVVLALLLVWMQGKHGLKQLRKLLLFFILFAAPALYHQLGADPLQGVALANDAQINSRGVHHYLPHAFSMHAYVHHIALLLLAGVILLLAKTENRKFIFRFSAIIIAGCIAYIVCFELWQLPFVAKTQWLRTTEWTTVCAGIVLAGFAGSLPNRLWPLHKKQD